LGASITLMGLDAGSGLLAPCFMQQGFIGEPGRKRNQTILPIAPGCHQIFCPGDGILPYL